MFARFKHHGRDFSRSLGLLLVVFILYGTTVEAAHRHGRILPQASGAAAHVENEPSQNLTTNKTGCSDCLICQLHLNFTATLISLRMSDAPARAPQRVEIVVSRDLLSQIVGPSPGRAPPFVS